MKKPWVSIGVFSEAQFQYFGFLGPGLLNHVSTLDIRR